LQTLRLFRKGRARHRREAQGGFLRNFVDPRLYAVRSGAHYQRGGRLLLGHVGVVPAQHRAAV